MGITVDVAVRCLNKHGEILCGDTVEMLKTPDSDVIILADGMGSGVKASILSTLTAKILGTMFAGGATLDVALREGGRVGEAAAVEGIIGIQVQRLHLQHAVGQFQALHAVLVVVAREVLGVLIDNVETEPAPIAVEVQLIVADCARRLGGVQRRTQRQAEVADAQAERRLPVGLHLRHVVLAVSRRAGRHGRAVDAFGPDLCSRHVQPGPDGPSGLRPHDVRRVDVALAVSLGQLAVKTLKQALR